MSETTTAMAETAPAPPPSPAAAPRVAAASPPVTGAAARQGRSVQIPIWVLVLLLGLALVVGAFLLGRTTADSSSGPATLAEAVEMTARGDMELGDFDARRLLDALRENPDLDLGILGELLLDDRLGDWLGGGPGDGRR